MYNYSFHSLPVIDTGKTMKTIFSGKKMLGMIISVGIILVCTIYNSIKLFDESVIYQFTELFDSDDTALNTLSAITGIQILNMIAHIFLFIGLILTYIKAKSSASSMSTGINFILVFCFISLLELVSLLLPLLVFMSNMILILSFNVLTIISVIMTFFITVSIICIINIIILCFSSKRNIRNQGITHNGSRGLSICSSMLIICLAFILADIVFNFIVNSYSSDVLFTRIIFLVYVFALTFLSIFAQGFAKAYRYNVDKYITESGYGSINNPNIYYQSSYYNTSNPPVPTQNYQSTQNFTPIIPSDTIQCKNCGTYNDVKAKFCMNCGISFQSDSTLNNDK